MPDINITRFFNTGEHGDFSASCAELGDDADKITWNNAMREAAETPMLDTPELLDAMRDWAKDTGAWDEDERAAWTPEEVNALFIQLVSGDIREAENVASDDDGEIDWAKYERAASEGQISGNMYRADDTGEIWYYLGG